jgi:hypothetical protein
MREGEAMSRGSRTIVKLACVLIVAVGACKSESPPAKTASAPAAMPAAQPPAAPIQFKVVAVDLGKEINADKKVAQPTAAFGTSDTIYAVVTTEGAAPSVALKARWTYEDGQLVNESAQTIAPSGAAATEFHIAKPGGWPTGKYKVEISANGALVTAKEFVVN